MDILGISAFYHDSAACLLRDGELFAAAQKVIPGGVNSPVRAFKAVGGDPLFFARGSGALMYDVDGAEYIDYVCSWGPLILGHAPEAIVREVRDAAGDGTSFGAPNAHEVELAQYAVDPFAGCCARSPR